MATMTTTNGKTYELLAEMTSSTSGKRYEIRKDSRGVTYCHDVTEGRLCKAWQFNRETPKTCKHIQRYHHDVAVNPTPVALKVKKATPAVLPYAFEAGQMVDAMLTAASNLSSGYSHLSVSDAQHKIMVQTLASRLATFKPIIPLSTPAPVAAVSTGVRMITFED